MPIIRRTRLFNAASGVCLVVLAVVLWSRDASSVHCVKNNFRPVHTACVPVLTQDFRNNSVQKNGYYTRHLF